MRVGLRFSAWGGLAVYAFFASAAAAAPPAKTCAAHSGLPAGGGDKAGMVFIPGGAFAMGSDRQRPEERFTHVVRVDGFWIDKHEVTNAQFQRFVAATGYVTRAERGPDPKTHEGLAGDMLVAGSALFVQPTRLGRGGDITQWWQYVKGASWREPEGPGSTIEGRDNHPVVHVAYEDAAAYARWRGRELPTEAQWEFAARGGRADEPDWMSAFAADGTPVANTWQGVFPVYDTAEDGYAGRAPVGCFGPNGYGLYDMIGNVWEWTSDWYRPGHAQAPADNPAGPHLREVHLAAGQMPSRVIKGGSYLCAPNYCARYRPTARQPQEADLSTGHVGFRTVLNVRKVSGTSAAR
jgi:formylglycine-generating enzyme required for sulfatase activity